MNRVFLVFLSIASLAGCGGGGGGDGGGGTPPPAPSGLSYPSPTIVLVGSATTLSPSVTGSVTTYSVSPNLPAGLSLNTSTGVISGSPMATTAKATYQVTASNTTGSTSFSLQLTVNPVAPSGLSYSAPGPLLRGVAVSLAPTVTGTVTTYSVTPALPAGLALDATTGIISGAPTTLTTSANYQVTAGNVTGSTPYQLTLSVQTGPTIQIAVAASGLSGDNLSYQWQSTDGVVQNVNAPQTTWTGPTGPGLHFVYVVVSNGKGGYAEGRIDLSTDAMGAPAPFVPAPLTYAAPAQAAPTDIPMRLFLFNFSGVAPLFEPWAGVPVALYDSTSAVQYPAQTTDLKGSVTFQHVPIGNDALYLDALYIGGAGGVAVNSNPAANCAANNNATPCGGPLTATNATPTQYQFGGFAPTGTQFPFAPDGFQPFGTTQGISSAFVGSVLLGDGTAAGIVEAFFGLDVPVNVSMMYPNCAAGMGCNNAYVNQYNGFTVPFTNPCTAMTLTVSIEKATPWQQAVPCTPTIYALPSIMLSGTSTPTISAMTATYNGLPTFNGASFAKFELVSPPITVITQPSDNLPGRHFFLSFKGEDTRLGACMYYQAIGAVAVGACNASGNYSSAVNFEDWKRTVQIDSYAAPGASTVTAAYVNVVDLNLTRVHHSISYGPNNVAAYVCNHKPPVDSSGNAVVVNLPASAIGPTQQHAVDTAVTNAVSGQSLVACVAMDYVVSPGTNGGHPFTRFLIFGPSGELLPSVNLDGRGEKFVPGACVACHGGDRYAGQYPTDGTGSADVGAHFLPYDAGNFAFSSQTGLTDAALEPAIYQLNQNVLNTNPTAATVSLITNWYLSGKTLNQSYVPTAWAGYNSFVYQNVIARNCRTCHVALSSYDWDASPALLGLYHTEMYGDSFNQVLNSSMPNSLVTRNRFASPQFTCSATNYTPAALFSYFDDPNNTAKGNPIAGGCTPIPGN